MTTPMPPEGLPPADDAATADEAPEAPTTPYESIPAAPILTGPGGFQDDPEELQ